MADKKTDSVKISGKCDGDDIRTCKFRIRRVGKTVVAQGQQGLADALASVMDGHARGKAKAAELGAPMMLLTKEIRANLPPLYSQENNPDPTVWVKFFTPDSNWTWYGIEFDGEDLFFGWVVGFEQELGYFSLHELETTKGKMGLPIERDKWFKPMPLSKAKEQHQHEHGGMGEPSHPYAHPRPKEILVFARTIEKHYLAPDTCDAKSIRVLKPEPNVLLYRCKRDGKWTTLKSIVNFTKVAKERRKRYFDDLKRWKDVGVPVRIRRGTGVEPRMEAGEPDLEELVEAMKGAEVVDG